MEPTELPGRDAPSFETDPRFRRARGPASSSSPGRPSGTGWSSTSRSAMASWRAPGGTGSASSPWRAATTSTTARPTGTRRTSGAHSIAYSGYNEGKGIWGTWEYQSNWRGGFLIWPVAMGDPTKAKLAEAVDVPKEAEAPAPRSRRRNPSRPPRRA